MLSAGREARRRKKRESRKQGEGRGGKEEAAATIPCVAATISLSIARCRLAARNRHLDNPHLTCTQHTVADLHQPSIISLIIEESTFA